MNPNPRKILGFSVCEVNEEQSLVLADSKYVPVREINKTFDYKSSWKVIVKDEEFWFHFPFLCAKKLLEAYFIYFKSAWRLCKDAVVMSMH